MLKKNKRLLFWSKLGRAVRRSVGRLPDSSRANRRLSYRPLLKLLRRCWLSFLTRHPRRLVDSPKAARLRYWKLRFFKPFPRKSRFRSSRQSFWGHKYNSLYRRTLSRKRKAVKLRDQYSRFIYPSWWPKDQIGVSPFRLRWGRGTARQLGRLIERARLSSKKRKYIRRRLLLPTGLLKPKVRQALGRSQRLLKRLVSWYTYARRRRGLKDRKFTRPVRQGVKKPKRKTFRLRRRARGVPPLWLVRSLLRQERKKRRYGKRGRQRTRYLLKGQERNPRWGRGRLATKGRHPVARRGRRSFQHRLESGRRRLSFFPRAFRKFAWRRWRIRRIRVGWKRKLGPLLLILTYHRLMERPRHRRIFNFAEQVLPQATKARPSRGRNSLRPFLRKKYWRRLLRLRTRTYRRLYFKGLVRFHRHRRPMKRRLLRFWKKSMRRKAVWRRKWQSTLRRIRHLKRGQLKGRRYDYAGPHDKFRWPTRIRKVFVVNPYSIAVSVDRRSQLFGKMFRFLHHNLDEAKPVQQHAYLFLRSFHRDLYGEEGVEPLAPAPRFLLPLSDYESSVLLSIFWQSPISVFDQNLIIDNYYRKIPPPSIWIALINHLSQQKPTVLGRLFCEDFATRELDYWTSFFESLSRYGQDSNQAWVLSHPSWYRKQLQRLIVALPFLPAKLRRFVAKIVRRFLRILKKEAILDARETALTIPQRLGRVQQGNERRKVYWIRRQTGYLRELYRATLPSCSTNLRRRRALSAFLRQYHHLRRILPSGYPKSKLHALFEPRFLLRKRLWQSALSPSFSKRFLRFVRRRRRFALLYRKERARRFGQLRRDLSRVLVRVRSRQPRRVQRPRSRWVGGLCRSRTLRGFSRRILSPFLWKLLLFWFVAFSKKFWLYAASFSNYQWLLNVHSCFTFSKWSPDSLLLMWAKLTSSFPTSRAVYRLACLEWVRRTVKKKHRRRKYFRRWFTGFFRRRRWSRLYLRRGRRIPRYYRRFRFIRNQPFSVFRVFWPQSANFIRRRRSRRWARRMNRRRSLPKILKTVTLQSIQLSPPADSRAWKPKVPRLFSQLRVSTPFSDRIAAHLPVNRTVTGSIRPPRFLAARKKRRSNDFLSKKRSN